MKSRFFRLSFFLTFFLSAGSLRSVHAQAPVETVSLTFQAIGWTASSDREEIFYTHEDKPSPLAPLHANLRSESYPYTGPATLWFYRMIKNEEGERVPDPVGRVEIPPDAKRLLLIFFPEEKGSYRILPLDDDLNRFPGGSYKFINISKTQFALQVGEDLKKIDYGETALFRIPSGELKSVELQMVKNDNGKWERFHQTVLPHHADRRVIFFLIEKEIRGRTLVQMRQLVDYASDMAAPPLVEDDTP